MRRTALVAVANGVEDIETITVVDVLRRAGVDVTLASVDAVEINTTKGVKVITDGLVKDYVNNRYDLIVLPGGMPGAEHLRDSVELTSMLKQQMNEGRLYAAICASPVVVFQHHDLLRGRLATCHPALVDRLMVRDAAESRVVVDKNCVTSQGPGTALEFSLQLVELLFDKAHAEKIAKALVA